jgi:hypothetical protein
MEYSQQLLDALGNQGWNARAIKDVVDQMSDMIKEEYHESFEGIWFSGFVRVGQEGPLEMITTRAVHAVSKGAGRDLNNLAKLLTFYSCRCLLQASNGSPHLHGGSRKQTIQSQSFGVGECDQQCT